MSTGFALLVPVSTATGVDRRCPSDVVHLVAIRVYGLQSMFASKSPPQEFIDSWRDYDNLIRFLPQFQRTSPPTQLEFAVPAHAEFVICDCTIEHMFRFLKQHMGLTASNSPSLEARLRWVWSCALAYTQLLLTRHKVADRRPAWHPTYVRGRLRPLTPRQVQRSALPFLLTLGSPASPPQPAGKGAGRPLGYRPEPRKRHPVVKKSKKQRKSA